MGSPEFAVAPQQLIEVPPGTEATFRGAMLTLRKACLDDTMSVDAVVERVLSATEERSRVVAPQPAPVEEAPAAVEAVVVPVDDGPSMFWLEAATDVGVMFLDPENVVSPVLRVGVGWRIPWVYARANAGLAVSSIAEQRTAVELQGSAGVVPLSWLEAGLVLGHRTGSSSPVEPWLEQTWFFGVESAQCLIEISDDTQLCFQESIYPFGRRLRRAEVNDGQIERVAPVRDSVFRFDLAAALRLDI